MIFHDRGNPVKYFSTSWETAQQKHQQAFFWIFCFSQFFFTLYHSCGSNCARTLAASSNTVCFHHKLLY